MGKNTTAMTPTIGFIVPTVLLTFYRGDSTPAIDYNISGLSGDITAVKMEVRPFEGSETVVRSFTSEAGDFVITDATAATFSLLSFKWEGDAGRYVYDIQLTLSGTEDTFTFCRGPFIITQDITNATPVATPVATP